MKKMWTMFIFVILLVTLTLPASATRSEGIRGIVEQIDLKKITVASKSYRIGKLFRVVIMTREGIHHYEKEGTYSDVRVGDKVSAVVFYDEMGTIYLARY